MEEDPGTEVSLENEGKYGGESMSFGGESISSAVAEAVQTTATATATALVVLSVTETLLSASTVETALLSSANTVETALLSASTSETSLLAAPTTAGTTFVQVNESTSLSFLSSLLLEILKLVFGHVPYFIFRLLSTTLSFTVTLDVWGFMYLSTLLVTVGVIFYRYRILNSYSSTLSTGPPSIQKNNNAFDLKPPDSTLEDQGRQYPDEFMNAFLSSIKVFGYLDRPVFQELARNLQTKKLKPGEILFEDHHTQPPSEEDLDFYGNYPKS